MKKNLIAIANEAQKRMCLEAKIKTATFVKGQAVPQLVEAAEAGERYLKLHVPEGMFVTDVKDGILECVECSSIDVKGRYIFVRWYNL